MIQLPISEPVPYGLIEALEAAGIGVVRQGGVWYGSDVVAAAAVIAAHDPVAAARAARRAELASHRYEREVAGTTVAGVAVDTTREARINMAGAVSLAQLALSGGQPMTINWKASDGVFHLLDAAQVIAVGAGAGSYVAACFGVEAQHAAAIDALTTVEAVLSYDFTTGWPA